MYYPKFTGAGMGRPPHEPHLTHCDYFLWDTLKDTGYRKYLTTLDKLELSIFEAIESISFQTLQDVVANIIVSLRHLCTAGGGHFEKIVFLEQFLKSPHNLYVLI